MAGCQGGGDTATVDVLQRIAAAISQSLEARSATGDATLQDIVKQLAGRLVDSEAKLTQDLVAIQAGLISIKAGVAASEATLTNALVQMPAVVASVAGGASAVLSNPGGRTIPDYQPLLKRRRGRSTFTGGPLGGHTCTGTSCRPAGLGAGRLQRVGGASVVPPEGHHFGCAVRRRPQSLHRLGRQGPGEGCPYQLRFRAPRSTAPLRGPGSSHGPYSVAAVELCDGWHTGSTLLAVRFHPRRPCVSCQTWARPGIRSQTPHPHTGSPWRFRRG